MIIPKTWKRWCAHQIFSIPSSSDRMTRLRRTCRNDVIAQWSDDMGLVELPAIALIGLLIATMAAAGSLVCLAKSVSIV